MKLGILLKVISTMPIWRPTQDIRVKALGLHWRGDKLLAMEVEEDNGSIKGVRPLGGGVEFGETWQQALQREFMEELGVGVTISGPPIVMENIYEHHGVKGHEILFIADVLFPPSAFEGQEAINFKEDGGIACTARWFDIHSLDGDGLPLFPKDLKDALTKRGKKKPLKQRLFRSLILRLPA